MAHLCVASRLPLLPVLCIVLFLLFLIRDVSPLLVYDRLTLLNLRDFAEKLPNQGFSRRPNIPPPLLASIPPHLWHFPSGSLRNSRRRRRGRRGGLSYRLRAHGFVLHSSFGLSRERVSYYIRGSTDPCYRWLIPAIPETGYPRPCCRPMRICRRGCVPENLRPVVLNPWIFSC